MTHMRLVSEAGKPTPDAPAPLRRVVLTPASSISVRPVHWVWDQRVAVGTLALLAGREGIGKSTLAYTLAADVTRGLLPGRYVGQPKAVLVAASEDSWEHTIVPRLMAANADLSRVHRVDVVSALDVDTMLLLPRDLHGLEQAAVDADAGLLLLDPLLSRLAGTLDTHKDSDVRQALEPLTALARRTGIAVLGIVHLNKSATTDPLTMLMGSRAFAAVARAVLFVLRDPDDDDLRLLGQPKNNLGRSTDLPTLTFRIDGAKVADTAEGEVWTGKLQWLGEDSRNITDALADGAQTGAGDTRTAIGDASNWLTDYLTQQGGTAPSRDIQAAARKEGHSESAVKRARGRLNIEATSEGYPRRSYWSLPHTQPSQVTTPGGSDLTELTELTDPTDGTSQVSQVSQVSQTNPQNP